MTQKVLEDEAFVNHFDNPVRVDTTVPDKVLELQDQYVYIGGRRYQIQFSFYDDKLFRLTFYSDAYTANHFDTEVAALRDTLVQTITTAQGGADAIYDLSFFDVESNRIVWSHVWNTDPNGVAYKIGLGENEFNYYSAMFIEWTWLADLYEQNMQQEQGEALDESADDF